MASIMPELRPQPPPQAPARASLDFNITRNGLTNMPRELLGGFVSKLYMEFLPPWEAQQFAGGSPNRVILKFDFELPIILPTPAGPDGAFQSVRMAMLPNLPVNPDGSDNTDLGPYTTGHLCAMALERLGPSPQSIRALEFAPLVPMLTFENALRPIVERGLHLFEFDTSDGSAHGYRDFV
ncbi:hypothetical protein F5Y05DRAFT_386430 [Hypoxylon sp. FL0543]|nr:hypothetical protein F5Y05DRAFT_386430 [Hypoxylon sp. FL0543]